MGGPVAAGCGVETVKVNRAMLRMGRRLTRHPQLGAAELPWCLVRYLLKTSDLPAEGANGFPLGHWRALCA